MAYRCAERRTKFADLSSDFHTDDEARHKILHEIIALNDEIEQLVRRIRKLESVGNLGSKALTGKANRVAGSNQGITDRACIGAR